MHPQLRNTVAFDKTGAVVQLVRIPACHAWGRGFESRPHRKRTSSFESWEHSSAGSERLPYKQRVGGSNPSAPTKRNAFTDCCKGVFLFIPLIRNLHAELLAGKLDYRERYNPKKSVKRQVHDTEGKTQ